MKRLCLVWACLFGLWAAPKASAFVMVGPLHASEFTSDANGTGQIDFNYTDDLGGPKDLKTFFRWNIPLLTYAFDASFMQYFGLEGRAAVKEAFSVVNDFFEPQENSSSPNYYSGVSELDLGAHGFKRNYSTAWENITAKNAHIIDIKSLTLGLVVNQLGLGNPYRYSFGIHSTSTNASATQINFNVRLRNYDPITFKATSKINDVDYSYRLIHNSPPSVGVTQLPTFADMEEFTTDSTGNAWSAVSAIADAFYGNTAIFWTEQPTLFGFGVYYDSQNASASNATQPRHALTYDDAGGLKYLYRTNNYVFEGLDPNVVLKIPANFLPTAAVPLLPGGSARIYPDPSGISGAYIPRRNAGLIPGLPWTSSVPVQAPPALVDVAMRGGIDKIQFQEQPFDSFLGINFTATTHFWTDVFVGTNGQNVVNLNSTIPGSSAFIGVPQLKHFKQEVGRAIFQPDILFVADELGVSPDGIPIAFNRTGNSLWVDNYTNNLGPAQLLSTNVGPGMIAGPIQYTFTKLGQGFEVVWSGETSVVGNTDAYSLWGHIRGSGANDFVVFPNDARISILENAVSPATTTPIISSLEILDTETQKIQASASLRRTRDSLIIEGSNLASATAIQVIDSDNSVLQEITGAIVQSFIISHNQLILPPGILSPDTEGPLGSRHFRIWNSLGHSPQYEINTQTPAFPIVTGPPVITHTDHDGRTYNRDAEGVGLKLFGYGFLSSDDVKLKYVRVLDLNGSYSNGSTDINGTFEIRSDKEASLIAGSLDVSADGPNKYVQISRDKINWSANGPNATTGLGPNSTVRGVTNGTNIIANITAPPVITSIIQGNSTNISFLDREQSFSVAGNSLNTAYQIEIVDALQKSLSPPAIVKKGADGQWESPEAQSALPLGVSVSHSGDRIFLSKNLFGSSADSGGSEGYRLIKITNDAGTGFNSKPFKILAKPQALFVGGFATPLAFNRDVTAGDTVIISGLNLSSVASIEIVRADGSSLSPNPARTTLSLDNPGFTASNNAIIFDSRKTPFQFEEVDSHNGTDWRRFKLHVSDGSFTLSSHDHRFYIGTPPNITDLQSLNGHFKRDQNATIVGSGLRIINAVEIVDADGSSIDPTSALIGINGVMPVGIISQIEAGKDSINISKNLFSNPQLDTPQSLGRRIRIQTPFGSITSDNNSSGAFSVSATPSFKSFGGSGFSATTETYDLSKGSLSVVGQNYMGINKIELVEHNGTTSPTVHKIINILDPRIPPAGIIFDETGTSFTLDSKLLDSNWVQSEGEKNRYIRISSAAGHTADSVLIRTIRN